MGLYNLRYTECYEDGDSKSFSKVKDVYQASGITIDKKEFICHVQKKEGNKPCKSWKVKTQAWEGKAS